MQIYQFPTLRFQFHNTLYNKAFQDTEFMESYSKFAKYVAPFFDSSGLKSFEAPIFRVHEMNAKASFVWSEKSPLSLITRRTKLIIAPMTPLFGTNSFCVESKPFLRDFNIVNLNIGQFLLHDNIKGIDDEFINFTGLKSVVMMMGFNHESS